jgi:hypothetical protein
MIRLHVRILQKTYVRSFNFDKLVLEGGQYRKVDGDGPCGIVCGRKSDLDILLVRKRL